MSGKARTSKPSVALPSAGDAYPLSAECAKMSSREVHRRLRSQSLRAQPAPAPELPRAVTSDGLLRSGGGGAAALPPVRSAPALPSQVDLQPFPPAAVALGAVAAAAAPAPPVAPLAPEPERSTSPSLPVPAGSGPAAAAAASSFRVMRSSRRAQPQDEALSARLGQSFQQSVVAAHGRTPRVRASPHVNSPDESSEWGVSAALSVAHSASSFSSVSVMSEATTVYTDLG